MAKVRFELVPPFHRFQLQDGEGNAIAIEQDGFETDDPALIAELEQHAEVERVAAKKGKSA